jgi:16S rRNA (guanine1207-N2)-methyltransferase
MSSHYFESQPSDPSKRREFETAVDGVSMRFLTERGVFAAEGLDQGTRALLKLAPPPPDTGTLLDLDLGSGIGPIAINLALRSPAATIWATDINERANTLCAANAELNGVSNISVAKPDDLPADVMFDQIWSNPPIRIGKALMHEMLLRWLARLTPDGSALLVVHKHLGSDSLVKWLDSEGWPTKRWTSYQGYRILRVTR